MGVHFALIGAVDLSAYLDRSIEEVSVGGESGQNARPCDYAWILVIREQYKQLGNSVCVPMIKAVAEEIKKQFFGREGK